MKFIYSTIFLMFLAGCSIVPVIDQWKNLDETQWQKSNPVTIPVTISDTDYYYNLAINLRVTNDYKYSNLYIKLNITDPAGKKASDPIMLTLADHRGKWVGHSLGHIISFRLPAQKDKVFSKAGKYTFELEQFMRDTVLKEVVSVGIKLDKQQEILK
ncbi:MAG: gliding motility lipoprotein GldH [Bacteroidia bacterium]